MPSMLTIPDERHGQLKMLADSLNISSADAVGLLLNEAIAAGRIDDVLPGWRIERKDDHVVFAVDDSEPVRYSPMVAREFSAQIRGAVSGGAVFNMDDDYIAVRVGNGVRIGTSSVSKPVSRAIALDIARRLERAAAA